MKQKNSVVCPERNCKYEEKKVWQVFACKHGFCNNQHDINIRAYVFGFLFGQNLNVCVGSDDNVEWIAISDMPENICGIKQKI